MRKTGRIFPQQIVNLSNLPLKNETVTQSSQMPVSWFLYLQKPGAAISKSCTRFYLIYAARNPHFATLQSRTNGRRTGRSSHTPDTPDLRRSFCSGADPAAARRKTSRTRCRCIRAWRAATARHAGCSRQNDLPRLVILIRPAPLQSLSAGLRRHFSSSSSKSGGVASFLVLGALFSSACAV